MINNRGIISIGNHNNIHMTQEKFDMELIKRELQELLKLSEDKILIKTAIQSVEEQNESKLMECLKKLGKESYELIKTLSLNVLGSYITFILTK